METDTLDNDSVGTRVKIISEETNGKRNLYTYWLDGDEIGLWCKDLIDKSGGILDNTQSNIKLEGPRNQWNEIIREGSTSSINDIFYWKENVNTNVVISSTYPYDSKFIVNGQILSGISVPDKQGNGKNGDWTITDLANLFAYYNGPKVSNPNLVFKHIFNVLQLDAYSPYFNFDVISIEAEVNGKDDFIAYDEASYNYSLNRILDDNNYEIKGKKRKIIFTPNQIQGNYQLVLNGKMDYPLTITMKLKKPKNFISDKTNEFIVVDGDFLYYKFDLEALKTINTGGNYYRVVVDGSKDPTVIYGELEVITINNHETGKLESELRNLRINSRSKKSVKISGGEINDTDFKYMVTNAYNLAEVDMLNTPTKRIPNDIFKGSKNLRKVKLSKSLSEIGDYAFDGCDNLLIDSLPEQLKSIGYAAFRGASLRKLKFTEGVRYRPLSFDNVEVLDEVEINGGKSGKIEVERSNSHIFYARSLPNSEINIRNINDLEDIDYLIKTDYEISGSNAVEPMVIENINFYENVKRIPRLSRRKNANSRSNKVGILNYYNDAVKVTDNNNYNWITGYPVVALHDNVSAYKDAFDKLDVDKIGLAIYGSDNISFEEGSLTNSNASAIEFVEGVKKFSPGLLSKNSGIPKGCFIKIYNTDPELKVDEDMFEDLDDDNPSVIDGLMTYVISNGKFRPISHRNFKVLQIEKTNEDDEEITDIGKELYDLEYRQVNLPFEQSGKFTIKHIESNSFQFNDNLTTIIGLEELEVIEPYAFADCLYLKRLTLPKVKEIKQHAFANSRIEELDLSGAPLTNLHKGCFANMEYVKYIDISNTPITKLPDFCCNQDASLERFIFNFDQEAKIDYTTTHNTIDSKVTSIGECAFQACEVLEINIPSSVKTIGQKAFFNCEDLKITINSTLSGEGLQTIGEKCFKNCANLYYIALPRSVKSIG
ncbi:MAG: hypothetical protein EZS28_026502 [Streblomastix strix]|uniref:Leucine-rich repeat domain-containing protein n=1 Tax=Streblomastix strix TaxID=222440 RepID=A0A5J4V6Z5_9EUKA|nr:MAG: hypothetical protein EZS28_026502 [Streblomastix strix]